MGVALVLVNYQAVRRLQPFVCLFVPKWYSHLKNRVDPSPRSPVTTSFVWCQYASDPPRTPSIRVAVRAPSGAQKWSSMRLLPQQFKNYLDSRGIGDFPPWAGIAPRH